MATFIMFGKYNHHSVKEISTERSDKAAGVVKESGGEIKSGYALLGDTDLVLITEFPTIEQAIKASVGLSKLLGISFNTSPAVSVEVFDALVG